MMSTVNQLLYPFSLSAPTDRGRSVGAFRTIHDCDQTLEDMDKPFLHHPGPLVDIPDFPHTLS